MKGYLQRSRHYISLSGFMGFFSFVLVLAFWNCLDAHAAYQDHQDQGTRVITASDLTPYFMEALKTYAPWSEDEMEITGIKSYPAKIRVPKGELQVESEPPPNGRYLGRVSFLMTIKVDGRTVRRIRMCAKVEVYRPVLCVAQALKRAHVLTGKDLILVKRPLSKLRGEAVSEMDKVLGQALKRSVQAGQVITSNLLTPPVLVRRGDRVTIVAESPSLVISVPGEVRQNGSQGDLIRVKNLMSKREVVARVLNAKTVSVSF